MPSVDQLGNVASVLAFVIWVAAFLAAAKALFNSFLVAEFQRRHAVDNIERTNRLRRLRFELERRIHLTPEIERGEKNTASFPLTQDELAIREAEWRELTKTNLWQRAVAWFMACLACQTFWIALATYLLANGWQGFVPTVGSAFAYSGTAMLLTHVLKIDLVSRKTGPQRANSGGCTSCGG